MKLLLCALNLTQVWPYMSKINSLIKNHWSFGRNSYVLMPVENIYMKAVQRQADTFRPGGSISAHCVSNVR